MIMRPSPRVKIPKENHIIGRYWPVLETTIPPIAEKAAPPREYGNILEGIH